MCGATEIGLKGYLDSLKQVQHWKTCLGPAVGQAQGMDAMEGAAITPPWKPGTENQTTEDFTVGGFSPPIGRPSEAASLDEEGLNIQKIKVEAPRL